jgi:hypothetical protein
MLSQEQIDELRYEIDQKGYVTDCPPDNLNFFGHQNLREVVNILNNDPDGDLYPEDYDEPYFSSVELDEPWGNCAAIFLTSSNNKDKALKALNKYADNYVRQNPECTRSW